MSTARTQAAIIRITAALARIEKVHPQDGGDEALRREVSATIAELDTLIDGLDMP
ncbi:MAG: hypothetical protein WA918_00615 [Erythrobacter sp.]